jgi:hypothetical protein
MIHLSDFPLLIFVLSLGALWLCGSLGAHLATRHAARSTATSEDFSIILAASLTLLGLIIGFSFSMATSRYDQRKNYEEAEANAIGTEYLRAGLLPAATAAPTRALLKSYIDQRILFYTAPAEGNLKAINAETERLQRQMWSEVEAAATAQPVPTTTLAAAGMNDVLNTQADTQAAWWNRIPMMAWAMMGLIAVLCNGMVGYAAPRLKGRTGLLFLLPLVLSIALALIADIDSPRGGLIHVNPQNLQSLADSLR